MRDDNVAFHLKMTPRSVTLWIEVGGKSKGIIEFCVPYDVMSSCTSPSGGRIGQSGCSIMQRQF